MLDRQPIWPGFGEITSPLGSTTLIASTILKARSRPSGLDFVLDGSYQIHAAC